MAEIRAERISKTYPGSKAPAVQDVSLAIADREPVVLLGPSGCGKTTLLRVIAGLEAPEAGRVLIGGRDVTDLPPRKRELAMVFQSYAVFPHLTVFENIAFGLRMRRRPDAEVKRRVERAAGLLQLEPLLGRYPARLSGGQRQRVAVARAREHLALDLDLRTGAPIRVRTCAGLAPLLVPSLERRVAGGLVHQLTGTSFAGAPAFAFPVVPSAAPGSPGFRPRAYWRGPSWPVVNWLLRWGLRRQGYAEQVSALRAANLALLARPEARFGEYFEPYTGEQLGSPGQSWFAAVTLDWLAHDQSWDRRPAARGASSRLPTPGC
jgi:predicted ABC-type transport system involved in lysophospholipase L1 biosynthesis ATPase subunit